MTTLIAAAHAYRNCQAELHAAAVQSVYTAASPGERAAVADVEQVIRA